MFDLYMALGDSMSIDFYPAQDALSARKSVRPDIGAASLLFQNDDDLFPEFKGDDIVTRSPATLHTNLAVDGGIAENVLTAENLKVFASCADKKCLVTLTLGGNDLLHAYRISVGRDPGELITAYQQVLSNYTKVVSSLTARLPNSTLVLTTVFDPTDGTGTMPTNSALYSGNFPIEFLNKFNEHVKVVAQLNGALVADVHAHFLGHGAACGSAENFWYWSGSPIEPSYRGASEIRRVWLSVVKPVINLDS
jgi:hypothetical protein